MPLLLSSLFAFRVLFHFFFLSASKQLCKFGGRGSGHRVTCSSFSTICLYSSKPPSRLDTVPFWTTQSSLQIKRISLSSWDTKITPPWKRNKKKNTCSISSTILVLNRCLQIIKLFELHKIFQLIFKNIKEKKNNILWWYNFFFFCMGKNFKTNYGSRCHYVPEIYEEICQGLLSFPCPSDL